MLRLIVPLILCLFSLNGFANKKIVSSISKLQQANAEAAPGDTIVLKNGNWNNVLITLDCNGTKNNPIYFIAETAGKVIICGNSSLNIAGNYIVVDGWLFANGFAGNNAVITFKNKENKVANNCRVTNTAINNFNNYQRLQENYWVALYGKNNQIDHCYFLDKKNIGVLLAVILNDDKSRENQHIIQYNYFGRRLPLASNGGEIIRVGVSEHCTYYSNTQIKNNFFEHCDGEAEIISIKSCGNYIGQNTFKECQGSVVLRHGDNNTVEGNYFLGNNKQGTGGVRIINKGQWVVNNYFYKCRGTGFRAPIAIMNGVPNSPANRYVAVSEAVVCTNTFIDCSPLSFCEGSDAERSITPYNTLFVNNYFKNTTKATIFSASDSISGITFYKNFVSGNRNVLLAKGFERLQSIKYTKNAFIFSDSLQKISNQRLQSSTLDIQTTNITRTIKKPLPNWIEITLVEKKNSLTFKCKNATEMEAVLKQNHTQPITIELTGVDYKFATPIVIFNQVVISRKHKSAIQFSLKDSTFKCLFYITAGSTLTLDNIQFNLVTLSTPYYIISDTSGASNHYSLLLQNISVKNYQGIFFQASKTSVADSIVVNHCTFSKNNGTLFNLQSETDKKGFYNTEYLAIKNCSIKNHLGQLITLLRSGKDESTLGPLFVLQNNHITNSVTNNQLPFIKLNGVQQSRITNNNFLHAANNNSLIEYTDIVRAHHVFENNSFTKSGNILKNEFVVEQKNIFK